MFAIQKFKESQGGFSKDPHVAGSIQGFKCSKPSENIPEICN